MAKTKLNSNPVDSYNKSQKKKELKKNKESRSQNRSNNLAFSDTFLIEIEIKSLEERSSKESLDKNLVSHLESLKNELNRINQAKDDYVNEHPEKRSEIFKSQSKPSEQALEALNQRKNEGITRKPNRKVFDSKGMPLNPQKSIYYDPVLNPHGNPPPGMPYAEKLSEEESDDDNDDDDDDDDIPMPSMPKPENDSDSDDFGLDDIPMPEGPPPTKISMSQQPLNYPLPPKPKVVTEEDKSKAAASATISSGPQIRDLQSETKTLLPAQVQRAMKKQNK